MKMHQSPVARRTGRTTLAALLVGGALAGLLATGNALACEAQPTRAKATRPVTAWVLSFNEKVSVAARCNGMVEAIGRMLTAGSALRISIFGYDNPGGSRSLSLAYVAMVAEELRAALQQKGRGQVRIHTVFGGPADEQAGSDPNAAGRIEIRVHDPVAAVGRDPVINSIGRDSVLN